MQTNPFKTYKFGDMSFNYLRPTEGSGMLLCFFPTDKENLTTLKRDVITGRMEVDNLARNKSPMAADYGRDSLLQIKLANQPSRNGFSAGMTLFDSPDTESLECIAQHVREQAGITDIQTELRHPCGLACIHHLIHRNGESGVEMFNEVINKGAAPVTLEMLSSFVINGISPFDPGESSGRLRLHRFRSWWSAEGRLETRTLEEMHLERPWITHGSRTEKFGQVGSMPVRRFFPFIAAEDTVAGVTWAAKLAWAGSWQMEAIRRGDTLALTGGLADREFGHWMKTLIPGETLISPRAQLSCSNQGLDDVCQRLVQMQEARVPHLPTEEDLPVIFNEWCTSWGAPTDTSVLAIAECLRELPVRYLVIDAGWCARPAGGTAQSNGDWIVDRTKFPQGLKPVADAVRALNMIPGIWFEFEICTPGSEAWAEEAHQLHKDGTVLQVGTRRFWNFRDPWVRDFLKEKLIFQLKENGFGYLKVDYNDTIGLGCDHPDSLGEGLRLHILAVQDFFRQLRAELPNLVIENCASGGHRMEPSMIELTSMSSFSDNHEGQDIPIIAANLQRLIPPRQNQIWAVLRKNDTPQRLVYSLCAGLLGRLCISGDIFDLSPEQVETVKAGLAFYSKAAPVIKEGYSSFFGTPQHSYRDPSGWQAVVRCNSDQSCALAVIHQFGNPVPKEIRIPLTGENWQIAQKFPADLFAEAKMSTLTVRFDEPFSAAACLLTRPVLRQLNLTS